MKIQKTIENVIKTRKMKNFIIILISGAFLLTGCKKFDETNNNPNAPEDVDPQFLLSNALWEASNNQSFWSWHAGSMLSQHSANLEFLPVDRYDLGNNEGLWNATYRLLNDLQDVQNSEDGNESYTAICQIISAHQLSLLTDLWTDVPYSEALKGSSERNFTPIFDSQEEIYTGENGILALLRSAVETLEGATAPVSGDILYNGDYTKWVKFANALRVRYLVRISSKVDVSEELQSIVDDGNLFSGNEENALIPYLVSSPNQWIIFNEREGRYVDVRMSKTAQDIMVPLNAPRVEIYYKPTLNSTTDYIGIPNGLSRESQLEYSLGDVSLMGSFLRDQPDGMNAIFMTYTELQFCLAEAAQKGYISGDANAYYEAGITASFQYHGATLPGDYLTNGSVVLDGSEDLKRIMTQKWIASFMNGYEAWFDVRRTGFPEMTISPDNLNGGTYPVRYRYPTTEQAVNLTNYMTAVATIGGDNYNSIGWWEE